MPASSRCSCFADKQPVQETFSFARNGQRICTKNSVQLHSTYNPENEGKRFAGAITAPFVPRFITVTEPALSYCVPFLRSRFPYTCLVAVRYSRAYADTDVLWDKVFYFTEPEIFEEQLFSFIGEEQVSSALFVSWKASEQAYPEQYAQSWQSIARIVRKSRDVLATRQYFGRRWLVNTVRFVLGIRKTAAIERGDMPVLLAASGPSLEQALPFIREYRDRFFLLSVSSALSPLLSAGIVPDACISTDGGYWAKEHLFPLKRTDASVPLILPAESAVPSDILSSSIVVPVSYGDGPETLLLRACSVRTMDGRRNGTVAGTAAEFALSMTSGNVYACGLDLSPSNGFSHARPHVSERRNGESRLSPLSTRTAAQNMPSPALDIYASWFASRDSGFTQRFFRIGPQIRHIPHIREIPPDSLSSVKGGTKKPFVAATPLPGTDSRRTTIREKLAEVLAEMENPETDVTQGTAGIWSRTYGLGECIQIQKYSFGLPPDEARSVPQIREARGRLLAETRTFFKKLDTITDSYDCLRSPV